MTLNGLRPVRTPKHKVTTKSNHCLCIAANWLHGDFVAVYTNQKWADDITYIWTAERWLYLGAVLDVHSCHVVDLAE
jgi:transposase InsO family protein